MRDNETRSYLDAYRQKPNLNAIGVHLKDVEKQGYTDGEFSTILVFNFDNKPYKEDLRTTLLGFVELDEFLSLDKEGLREFFEYRFGYLNASKRLKKRTERTQNR